MSEFRLPGMGPGRGFAILQAPGKGDFMNAQYTDSRGSSIRSWLIATALAALLVPAADVTAQQEEDRRRQLRLDAPPTLEFAARGERAAPGITLGIPSGFGPNWRDAAIGVGFQATTRLENRPDGVVALAFGLGDATDAIGIGAVVASYGTVRSCCRGGISLKAHRVLIEDVSVAVGLENGVVWGTFDPNPGAEPTDGGRSVFGVASAVVHLPGARADPFRSLTFTLGVGNGRFRTESDIIADRSTFNVFGGVSLRMSRGTSLVADWTGQDLVGGFSFLPFRRRPFVIIPGLADITTKPRLVIGAAYGFDYLTLFR